MRYTQKWLNRRTDLFHQPTLMHNFLYSLTICLLRYYCALKLVDEIILYYDARSKKLQKTDGSRLAPSLKSALSVRSLVGWLVGQAVFSSSDHTEPVRTRDFYWTKRHWDMIWFQFFRFSAVSIVTLIFADHSFTYNRTICIWAADSVTNVTL